MNFLENYYSTPIPATRPFFDEFTYHPWLDGSSDPPDGNQVERFTVGRKFEFTTGHNKKKKAYSAYWCDHFDKAACPGFLFSRSTYEGGVCTWTGKISFFREQAVAVAVTMFGSRDGFRRIQLKK